MGLFIVYSAIGLAFEQRRVLFRTLRALGLSRRSLMYLLASEALVLATLGGGVGVVLGYIMAASLLPGVAATLSGLYGASVSGSLSLNPFWWLIGFGMAYFGAAVAVSGNLWQMSGCPYWHLLCHVRGCVQVHILTVASNHWHFSDPFGALAWYFRKV